MSWQQGAGRTQDYLHLAEVIQVDSVVGRAKGQEIGGHWAELHTADIGLGIYHCCWRLITDAPQAHCAVIATRDKSRGVCLHARMDCFSAKRITFTTTFVSEYQCFSL